VCSTPQVFVVPEFNVSLDWLVLQNIVDASPDGVVVCDATRPGWPVTYVNRSFEQLTGYSSSELQGKSLSLLQRGEGAKEDLTMLSAALREGIACRVVLHNYRKDGAPFLNELQLIPIRDSQGRLTHFVSFHRPGLASVAATIGEPQPDPMLNTQRMLAYVREDKLTGLLRRSYFEDLLRRDFALTQREGKTQTVMVFGIDHAAAYREVFGAAGAEQTFKRVARAVAACFRRTSDLCTRWEDTEIVAASMSTPPEQAQRLAELVMGRVRDLAIHHPRSGASRFVTISAGVVSEAPPRGATPEQFIARGLIALGQARNQGTHRVSMAG
jgi:diguanylate cyclase (GGDEF)-like protein/PAS domain S-box-containing protein